MTREEMVAGLREAADFIEAHPDLEVYADHIGIHSLDLSKPVNSVEELVEVARRLGKADKHLGDHYAEVTHRVGPVTFGAFAPRSNVCERIVTGTREVERPITQEVGTETVTEEVVEWRCEPLLGRDAGSSL